MFLIWNTSLGNGDRINSASRSKFLLSALCKGKCICWSENDGCSLRWSKKILQSYVFDYHVCLCPFFNLFLWQFIAYIESCFKSFILQLLLIEMLLSSNLQLSLLRIPLIKIIGRLGQILLLMLLSKLLGMSLRWLCVVWFMCFWYEVIGKVWAKCQNEAKWTHELFEICWFLFVNISKIEKAINSFQGTLSSHLIPEIEWTLFDKHSGLIYGMFFIL